MKRDEESIPNRKRAICAGTFITVKEGERVKRKYNSGEALVGDIPQDDAPPYTGYVRGWFKKGWKR